MSRYLLGSLLLVMSGCGSPSKPHSNSKDLLNSIEKAREAIPKCDNIVVFTDAYEGCHQPNGGLYHGLLCFSGEQWACDQMYRFIRSDSLVKDPLHPTADHGGSGSRDELLGHLFYLVKTKDTAHAEMLLELIRNNNNKVCTDGDERCVVTPAMWGLMRIVWNHIGLQPTPNMLAGNILDDTTLSASAETAPLGYQTHLIALTLLLRKESDTWSPQCTLALKSLERRWGDNLLVKYIAGKNIEAALIQAIKNNKPLKISSWPWANDDGLRPSSDHPAGFVFLGNLLTK